MGGSQTPYTSGKLFSDNSSKLLATLVSTSVTVSESKAMSSSTAATTKTVESTGTASIALLNAKVPGSIPRLHEIFP